MCGLAGIIASDGRADVTAALERLTGALAHRGPDGLGFRYECGRAMGLGHRRLSIVDLVTGDQPMGNEDGRLWVVLNGELYNHFMLRAELEALGHRFVTRSDVEVLVHGWEEWGPAILERLNGMYAFALFDGRATEGTGTVWLARDPVGIKPLYVGISADRWWFASELAAARDSGLVDPVLRAGAFAEYLFYRFIPSPGTFYRNVWKVPPGHLLRLPLDALPRTFRFTPFRTAFAPSVVPERPAEWAEALRGELRAAVRRQLMADVPVASLLSGGVDSTVITTLMRDVTDQNPQAYAVGFRDCAAGDELRQARRAAAAIGVGLVEHAVEPDAYLSAWPAQIGALGEPIANPGVLLLGLLCRRVREGHKVALTGQGADEPLGGYPRHVAERAYPLLRRIAPLLTMVPDSLLRDDRLPRLRRIARSNEEASRFAQILAVFSASEVSALVGEPVTLESLARPVRDRLSTLDDTDGVNRLLRVDAHLSLADDLLVVADHTSMAWGVELRVPFLDLEVLALIDKLPSRFKISRLGERKWFYREAVTPLLPAALRADLAGWRARTGRKLGFTTPMNRWFDEWVKTDADEFLAGPHARLPQYLQPAPVRRLVRAVRDQGHPGARQILSLFVLEHWLRQTIA